MWPFRFAMHKRRGLRNMVVYLLSSSPKNGVELMDGVETITRGWWRPTPGSIYPLLEKMVEEGSIQKRVDGKYELTPDAKNEAEVSFGPWARQPKTVEGVTSELSSLVSYLEDLKGSGKMQDSQLKSLRGLAKRVADLADAGADRKGDSP
jgi:DNA-binding PadR family transcriptional regulator